MKLIKSSSEILKQKQYTTEIASNIIDINNILNCDIDDISLFEHVTVYLLVGPTSKPSWLINGVSAYDDDFDEKLWVHTNEEASVIEKKWRDTNDAREFYIKNKYSKVHVVGDSQFITTNYRVLSENKRLRDLQFACVPTQFHEKRITLHLTCNKHTCNELMKYRVFSLNNNLNNVIGNELTYIIPEHVNMNDEDICQRLFDIDLIDYADAVSNGHRFNTELDYLFFSLYTNAYSYCNLINMGWTHKQAASILSDYIKTEVVISGFETDFIHLLSSEKYNKDIITLIKTHIKNETKNK